VDVDPERAARLLLTERDAVLPLLSALGSGDADRPTVLPGWSVWDVVAHCAAAMSLVGRGESSGWSAEENQRDVDERRTWPFERVLAELSEGYAAAARAVAGAGGALDGLALGEWVHGGDVREALGAPDAYASDGIEDALELIEQRSRLPRFSVPPTSVTLPDRELVLGHPPATARLDADAATLVRLVAGRSPDPPRYSLSGAAPDQLLLFRDGGHPEGA
jgi:uncharacterized protein (TIGR03083 family)